MEIRGYFIADDKGHVAGTSYENRFPCGYAIDPKGAKTPISFIIANAVKVDHDYKGEHCEVPDAAIILSDNAMLERNPLLKDIKEGKEIKAKVTGYQKKIFDRLAGTEIEKAELLQVFLSRLFLGRTFDEVKAKLVGRAFVDTVTFEGVSQQVDAFQRCNLEDYGL